MNFEQLQKLMNGETVKIGKNNTQIFCQEGYFVVEFFEFTLGGKEDMFSIGPDFINIEDAMKVAENYTSESYTNKRWGKAVLTT